MESVKRFLEDLGINLIMLVAGALGGFIKQSRKENLNFFERFAIIMTGSIIANYVGPIVGKWLSVSNEVKYGFAFLLGYIGIEVMIMLSIRLKKILKNINITKDDKS